MTQRFRYSDAVRHELTSMLGQDGDSHIQSIEYFINELQADIPAITGDVQEIKRTQAKIDAARRALSDLMGDSLARGIMASREGLKEESPLALLETATDVLAGIESTTSPWSLLDGRQSPASLLIAWMAVEWAEATKTAPTAPSWREYEGVYRSAFGDFVTSALEPLGLTASRDAIRRAIEQARIAEPAAFPIMRKANSR